jgi:hypothetical protein
MSNKLYSTPLSDTFFSSFNREYLHGAIVRNVKAKTGMNIDRQNDPDLQALMRSVYQHMMASPDDKSQVSKMNDIVVKEATKTISTGILQQLSYMDFIGRNPVPLSMPVSTSTYGYKMSSQSPGL